MAVPVSLGDIFTTIQLVDQFARIVTDTGAANAEYASLVRDINNIRGAMALMADLQESIKALISVSTPDAELVPGVVACRVDNAAVASLQEAITEGEAAVRELMEILAQYDTDGLKGVDWRSKVHRVFRRIRWAFSSARKEIQSKRLELLAHSSHINQILHTLSTASAINLQRLFIASHVRSPGIVDYITLTDILDRTFPVAMHHCLSRADLHDYLVFEFRSRPGLSFIEAHDYEFTDEQDREIDAFRWVSHLKPGATLRMTALIKLAQSAETKESSRVVACPVCDTANDGGLDGEGNLSCSQCGAQISFRIVERTTRRLRQPASPENRACALCQAQAQTRSLRSKRFRLRTRRRAEPVIPPVVEKCIHVQPEEFRDIRRLRFLIELVASAPKRPQLPRFVRRDPPKDKGCIIA